ncbi:MAG: hypothetical protein Q4D00_08690 [Clostridia bacterium]|nr:hypothetical protein [Clostridia bacterium]
MIFKYLFNITAFDGEGGGATAGAAAVSGGTSQAAAESRAQGTDPMVQTAASSTETVETFDDYIKNHKDEAQKWFDDKFNRRHKDYGKLKEQSKTTTQVMDMLATRFGIDDRSDYAAIMSALENDDYLYAERAEENGRSIEEQRQWDRIDRENRMFREQQREYQLQEDSRRKYAEWEKQSNNLKQIFPNFDLDYEVRTNERFKNFLLNGYEVSEAYYAVHGKEIVAGAMENTAQRVRQATAQEIAAGGGRPRENGLSGQATAKLVGKDFSHMNARELKAYAEQHAKR